MRRQAASVLLIWIGLAASARADESIEARTLGAVRDLAFRYATPEVGRELGPWLLEAVEWLAARCPGDRDVAAVSAELTAAWSFAFCHEADPAEAIRLYELAWAHAARALSPDGSFARAAVEGGDALDRDLGARTARDVPALYWGAVAWGARLDLQRDSLATPAELPSVVAILERVLVLDPGFEYGGPDMLIAHQEAILGPGLGGDNDRMKARFDASIDRTGGRYLLARVQRARDYAVAAQDRDLFETTLRDVLAASAEDLPERAFFNRVAQERAASYLARAEEFFP